MRWHLNGAWTQWLTLSGAAHAAPRTWILPDHTLLRDCPSWIKDATRYILVWAELNPPTLCPLTPSHHATCVYASPSYDWQALSRTHPVPLGILLPHSYAQHPMYTWIAYYAWLWITQVQGVLVANFSSRHEICQFLDQHRLLAKHARLAVIRASQDNEKTLIATTLPLFLDDGDETHEDGVLIVDEYHSNDLARRIRRWKRCTHGWVADAEAYETHYRPLIITHASDNGSPLPSWQWGIKGRVKRGRRAVHPKRLWPVIAPSDEFVRWQMLPLEAHAQIRATHYAWLAPWKVALDGNQIQSQPMVIAPIDNTPVIPCYPLCFTPCPDESSCARLREVLQSEPVQAAIDAHVFGDETFVDYVSILNPLMPWIWSRVHQKDAPHVFSSPLLLPTTSVSYV